jgi:hypothetical protein
MDYDDFPQEKKKAELKMEPENGRILSGIM